MSRAVRLKKMDAEPRQALRAANKKRNERKPAHRVARNRQTKSTFRTAIKKFNAACVAGDKALAEETLKLSVKLLDSAASKGIIHKNTAARTKSRLTLKFNKLA